MVSEGARVRPVGSYIASSDRDVAQERQQTYADPVRNIAGRDSCDERHCIGRCSIYRALMADVRVKPFTDCQGRISSKRSQRSRHVACDGERHVPGDAQRNDAFSVAVLQPAPVDLVDFIQSIEACPVRLIGSIHTSGSNQTRTRKDRLTG